MPTTMEYPGGSLFTHNQRAQREHNCGTNSNNGKATASASHHNRTMNTNHQQMDRKKHGNQPPEQPCVFDMGVRGQGRLRYFSHILACACKLTDAVSIEPTIFTTTEITSVSCSQPNVHETANNSHYPRRTTTSHRATLTIRAINYNNYSTHAVFVMPAAPPPPTLSITGDEDSCMHLIEDFKQRLKRERRLNKELYQHFSHYYYGPARGLHQGGSIAAAASGGSNHTHGNDDVTVSGRRSYQKRPSYSYAAAGLIRRDVELRADEGEFEPRIADDSGKADTFSFSSKLTTKTETTTSNYVIQSKAISQCLLRQLVSPHAHSIRLSTLPPPHYNSRCEGEDDNVVGGDQRTRRATTTQITKTALHEDDDTTDDDDDEYTRLFHRESTGPGSTGSGAQYLYVTITLVTPPGPITSHSDVLAYNPYQQQPSVNPYHDYYSCYRHEEGICGFQRSHSAHHHHNRVVTKTYRLYLLERAGERAASVAPSSYGFHCIAPPRLWLEAVASIPQIVVSVATQQRGEDGPNTNATAANNRNKGMIALIPGPSRVILKSHNTTASSSSNHNSATSISIDPRHFLSYHSNMRNEHSNRSSATNTERNISTFNGKVFDARPFRIFALFIESISAVHTAYEASNPTSNRSETGYGAAMLGQCGGEDDYAGSSRLHSLSLDTAASTAHRLGVRVGGRGVPVALDCIIPLHRQCPPLYDLFYGEGLRDVRSRDSLNDDAVVEDDERTHGVTTENTNSITNTLLDNLGYPGGRGTAGGLVQSTLKLTNRQRHNGTASHIPGGSGYPIAMGSSTADAGGVRGAAVNSQVIPLLEASLLIAALDIRGPPVADGSGRAQQNNSGDNPGSSEARHNKQRGSPPPSTAAGPGQPQLRSNVDDAAQMVAVNSSTTHNRSDAIHNTWHNPQQQHSHHTQGHSGLNSAAPAARSANTSTISSSMASIPPEKSALSDKAMSSPKKTPCVTSSPNNSSSNNTLPSQSLISNYQTAISMQQLQQVSAISDGDSRLVDERHEQPSNHSSSELTARQAYPSAHAPHPQSQQHKTDHVPRPAPQGVVAGLFSDGRDGPSVPIEPPANPFTETVPYYDEHDDNGTLLSMPTHGVSSSGARAKHNHPSSFYHYVTGDKGSSAATGVGAQSDSTPHHRHTTDGVDGHTVGRCSSTTSAVRTEGGRSTFATAATCSPPLDGRLLAEATPRSSHTLASLASRAPVGAVVSSPTICSSEVTHHNSCESQTLPRLSSLKRSRPEKAGKAPSSATPNRSPRPPIELGGVDIPGTQYSHTTERSMSTAHDAHPSHLPSDNVGAQSGSVQNQRLQASAVPHDNRASLSTTGMSPQRHLVSATLTAKHASNTVSSAVQVPGTQHSVASSGAAHDDRHMTRDSTSICSRVSGGGYYRCTSSATPPVPPTPAAAAHLAVSPYAQMSTHTERTAAPEVLVPRSASRGSPMRQATPFQDEHTMDERQRSERAILDAFVAPSSGSLDYLPHASDDPSSHAHVHNVNGWQEHYPHRREGVCVAGSSVMGYQPGQAVAAVNVDHPYDFTTLMLMEADPDGEGHITPTDDYYGDEAGLVDPVVMGPSIYSATGGSNYLSTVGTSTEAAHQHRQQYIPYQNQYNYNNSMSYDYHNVNMNEYF